MHPNVSMISRRTEAPQATQWYAVDIEGHPRTFWNSPQLTVKAAVGEVYASPEAQADAVNALKRGQAAQWQYGFRCVAIVPPNLQKQTAHAPH